MKALRKVKELIGEKSILEDNVGERLKESSKPTQPGKKLPAKDLWRYGESDTSAQFASYPLGMKFSVSKDTKLNIGDFTGDMGLVEIWLTPRKGKTGEKRVPTMDIAAFVPKEGETLQTFSARFMKKGKWESYQMSLGLNEQAWTTEDGALYKADGGAKVLFITFERPEPADAGYIFETPSDFPKNKDQSPTFYRLTEYHERIRGRLFYQIWLEAPKAFYGDAFGELAGIMKTFVVE
jgi:hypothetical protein